MGDFLGFKKMITMDVMKINYVLGAVALFIAFLVFLVIAGD